MKSNNLENNYNRFISYYREVSELFARFGTTTNGIQFDEKKEALEVYFLMSIKIAERSCKAIVVLLENNLPNECFSIIRNNMESFINLNWIVTTKDRNTRIDRVFRLEADVFRKYENEIWEISKFVNEPYSFYTKKQINKIKNIIETEKELHEELTQFENGKRKYKSLKMTIINRMGDKLRIKYYHFYRFLSSYTHPSPFLKIFLLGFNKFDKNPNEIVFEPVINALTNGLLFFQLIMGYSLEIFQEYNSETNQTRLSFFTRLEQIYNEAQKP